jgi:hypothetical protein
LKADAKWLHHEQRTLAHAEKLSVAVTERDAKRRRAELANFGLHQDAQDPDKSEAGRVMCELWEKDVCDDQPQQFRVRDLQNELPKELLREQQFAIAYSESKNTKRKAEQT